MESAHGAGRPAALARPVGQLPDGTSTPSREGGASEGGADEAKGYEASGPVAPTSSVADLANTTRLLLDMWGDDKYGPDSEEDDIPEMATSAARTEAGRWQWQRRYILELPTETSAAVVAVRTFRLVEVEKPAVPGRAPTWCLACTEPRTTPTSAQLIACRELLWQSVQDGRKDEDAAAPLVFYLLCRAHRGWGPSWGQDEHNFSGAASAAWFRLLFCVDTTVDGVVAVVFDQPCSLAADYSEQFVYLHVESGEMELGGFEPGVRAKVGAPEYELAAPTRNSAS